MTIQAVQYSGTIKDDSHQILTSFFDDAFNLCIWERTLSSKIDSYAVELLSQNINIVRSIAAKDAESILEVALPKHTDKNSFIQDVLVLVDMTSCLFECDSVGLRLATLNRAMCPKFHTDKISGRLICTYFGASTQWLESEYPHKSSKDLINSDKQKVMQASSGDVLLLKGEAWPDNEQNGIVHRSPICNQGDARLLLTIDPL